MTDHIESDWITQSQGRNPTKKGKWKVRKTKQNMDAIQQTIPQKEYWSLWDLTGMYGISMTLKKTEWTAVW